MRGHRRFPVLTSGWRQTLLITAERSNHKSLRFPPIVCRVRPHLTHQQLKSFRVFNVVFPQMIMSSIFNGFTYYSAVINQENKYNCRNMSEKKNQPTSERNTNPTAHWGRLRLPRGLRGHSVHGEKGESQAWRAGGLAAGRAASADANGRPRLPRA